MQRKLFCRGLRLFCDKLRFANVFHLQTWINYFLADSNLTDEASKEFYNYYTVK
jgi:hypothetical protein